MVVREASLGDERRAELIGLQTELAGTAPEAAVERDMPAAASAASPVPGAAGAASDGARVRGYPLFGLAAAFLTGVAVGVLLRPAPRRTGRDFR